MSSNDLNYVVDTMATALSKRPTNSIGFIVAPWLSSERIVNAQRGERRRVEDKCDARNLMTAMITVRMQPPPQSKHVPMIFHAWVVFDESSFGDNIFNECALMLDRQGSNIS
ncbi:unnamed protein product [Durusdinium trenchii]|uniref:Uncharacterized protein n=1 Tax=Durusdinium trenchii TaxID=1381693 RepID=A0ABP0QQH5_9DINO